MSDGVPSRADGFVRGVGAGLPPHLGCHHGSMICLALCGDAYVMKETSTPPCAQQVTATRAPSSRCTSDR